MSPSPRPLDEAALRGGLPIQGLGEPLLFLPSVGSTNDAAAELARQGAPHGALIVAEAQTAGRGREGRRWSTPRGTGVALSLVVRGERVPVGGVAQLSALGALAVVEALDREGVEGQIKWPNDVLLSGRKVAGILAENTWSGDDLLFSVLGIGVNVHPASVPPDSEVDFPPGCVEDAVGHAVDRGALILKIVAGLAAWLPRLGMDEFGRAWEARLAYRGDRVAVEGAEARQGRLVGLTPDGRLRLQLEGGQEIQLRAEGIRLRSLDSPGASATLGSRPPPL
jgi:BirA family biotin operon repressor/biotin-[acetyl-CoA-carboxylase] ligase